jgi:uncharacterized protein (DUF2252 family)
MCALRRNKPALVSVTGITMDRFITSPERRAGQLTVLRRQKMARSAHAYVRGSTAKFYDWLALSGARLPDGPPLWICGDCHVGNLGPVADAKGRVAVQIRDLDQTVIGNPAHDIVRLGLSLASAARSADLSGIITSRMLEALSRGYRIALQSDFDKGMDLAHKPKRIQALLRMAVKRRWQHLAAERLRMVEPKFALGKRFWPVSKDEREALTALFTSEKTRRMVAVLNGHEANAPLRLMDVAYWVKGCSSLGRLRYAVLLGVGEGRKLRYGLFDIKEGTAAAAPHAPAKRMPRDNAVRVVTGAKALSPHLGGRMMAAHLLGKAVVIRELMPQDLKIDGENLDEDDSISLARYLGYAVGRAHGRQLSDHVRGQWFKEMSRDRADDAATPGWLWSAVVDLMGVHEAAYLDHCRAIAADISEARRLAS